MIIWMTVKETNKKLVQDTIDKLIKSGAYKDIADIKRRNPSLQDFCFNNKLNFIMYSFSSQFTNDDYLNLLKQLEEEKIKLLKLKLIIKCLSTIITVNNNRR